jgi:hypothetical protein
MEISKLIVSQLAVSPILSCGYDIGFGIVNIFLIELLFSDEGICIEDAQPIKGQAKELCQLLQYKQGVAILHNIVK